MCVQTINQQIDQKKGMLVRWSGNQVFTRDSDFLVKDGLSVQLHASHPIPFPDPFPVWALQVKPSSLPMMTSSIQLESLTRKVESGAAWWRHKWPKLLWLKPVITLFTRSAACWVVPMFTYHRRMSGDASYAITSPGLWSIRDHFFLSFFFTYMNLFSKACFFLP